MSERAIKCGKCQGELAQGFLVDKMPGGYAVAEWSPGSPTASFWTGTKRPTESLPICAFRCLSCGYLEFYAGVEFARS